jgi:hypothetical protein
MTRATRCDGAPLRHGPPRPPTGSALLLFLHAAAYWLLDTLPRCLPAQGYPPVHLDALRLRLLKVDRRVRELAGRVRLHLANGHPSQALWDLLAASFQLRE